VKSDKAIKDEITVTSKGLILRGTRIVLPQSLQQRAIDLAHESHLGLSKTKALLREKIWFPNIDKLVKSTLERCLPCQAVGKPPPPEPLAMTEMPKGPWERVHLDFYGPLPTGEYLLVVIDRYSRYPEVEIVRATKASTVIPKLDKIFATHGIPRIVKSDNGPPFNGEEYRRYLETLGIKPEFSTPYWPQGNAEAERFMQPLGKALKTAHLQGRPWQQELSRFLLQYRTAPHTSTGVAPSELLYNRTVKGKLPVLKKRNVVNKHKQARANESKKQQYNKEYADHRRNVKTSDIRIGDCVLVRQERQNKLTSRFSTTPYTVTTRNKSKVTARSRSGHTITRNVSHFKRIPKQYESDTDDERTTVTNDQGQNETGDNQDQLPVVPTRRSGRERRIPERYGQPLSWTLNL
jgi:transposase InsO family protein